ncbi:MAG: hypothetical protein ACF8XB_18095 [Planctomycetota bacterium JB042]
MMCSAPLLFVLSSLAFATTDLSITGHGLGATASAGGFETLAGTSKGRIRVAADEGAWNLLFVDVALRTPNPQNAQEVNEAAALLGNHAWLTPHESTVGTTITPSLAGLVDAQDLAAADGAAVWLDPALVIEQVAAAATAGPDFVKQLGQPVLAQRNDLTWCTQFPTWTASPVAEYWLTTFSHPGGYGAATTFDVIDWTRLLENAAVKKVGAAAWRQFARGGGLNDAAAFGLELRVQAVSLQGNPIPTALSTAEATPGLVTASQEKPHFKISQPITIAIPYIPPFLPAATIPYEPGVLDPTLGAGTMIAAIGRMTSATHAVFPAGSEFLSTPLLRWPEPEGPLAFFEIPAGAKKGYVRFEDLIGVHESEACPVEGFAWDPVDTSDTSGD